MLNQISSKRIIIVTSAQLAANPRAIKEAIAFSKARYIVTVIYVPISPWADEFDSKIQFRYPSIQWVRAGFHFTENKWRCLYARLRRKIHQRLFRSGLKKSASFALALFTQELVQVAAKYPAELYIAHNLGALPAALYAAKKYKAKVAFDAEDFHRGEDVVNSFQWKCCSIIEEMYLKYVNYITTASPLITEAYIQLFSNIPVYTINNAFSIQYLQSKSVFKTGKTLKLFWFSQTIGKGRGLEDVIQAMGVLAHQKIVLTLLGNISDEMLKYFKGTIKIAGLKGEQVEFISPVEEATIPLIAANHDIGLALEVPYNLNHDKCLANKIFIYLLAGNAIVFSNTSAQKRFVLENGFDNNIYESGSVNELAALLMSFIENKKKLAQQRAHSWELARFRWNWEAESKQLLKIVETCLKD